MLLLKNKPCCSPTLKWRFFNVLVIKLFFHQVHFPDVCLQIHGSQLGQLRARLSWSVWVTSVLGVPSAAGWEDDLRAAPTEGKRSLKQKGLAADSPHWEDRIEESDFYNVFRGFSGGPVFKNPPSSARDIGSIPGQGTKTPYAARGN